MSLFDLDLLPFGTAATINLLKKIKKNYLFHCYKPVIIQITSKTIYHIKIINQQKYPAGPKVIK
jgi:hypothetical protein